MKKLILGILLSAFLVPAFQGVPQAQAQPEEDVKCPCMFDSVPKTPECWDETSPFEPPNFESPITDQGKSTCSLREIRSDTRTINLQIFESSSGHGCQIFQDGDGCGPSASDQDLTSEELKACQCELQAYATALNEGGIKVLGGPPYACGDCSTVTASPIPSLSEWGLIAMAAVLGIVGYLVIRRRKVRA